MTNRLALVPGASEKFGLAYWELMVDDSLLREVLDHFEAEDRELDSAGLGPVGDYVPVLVHNWPNPGTGGALQLLGDQPSELANGRGVLYVCGACGDLACGAVTVTVERTGRTVVWRDFGWDDGSDDAEEKIRFVGGPFVFEREQYDAELRRFVETYESVRASLPDRTRPAPGPQRRRRWPWAP